MNSSQPGMQGANRASSDAMPELRDNQQRHDDNQASGESVVAAERSGDATQRTVFPNQAASKESAEGSLEAAGASGDTRLPPRGAPEAHDSTLKTKI